ncbi:MAG: OmpH family outer membrane protein [Alphaproteobacteria bacterium]|nr:OmpH family outer membrane protein [Alphaproteobacteria bacterium]
MKTMKKILLLAGIVTMTVIALPAIAANKTIPVPSVQSFGVVDMSKVMQTTSAAKDIFSQLDSRREEYQILISKEEGILRAAGQKIEKQKNSLSKNEFDKKRKEFEKQVASGQKLVNDRKQILDQAFNSSMKNLRDKAAKIVADVAKEKGYSLVFTQDAVMLSASGFDITDVVVERLNKSTAKFPVEWPAVVTEKAPVVKSDKKK